MENKKYESKKSFINLTINSSELIHSLDHVLSDLESNNIEDAIEQIKFIQYNIDNINLERY